MGETTSAQRLAILEAAICRANIRAIAMQAANIECVQHGQPLAYPQKDFLDLIEEEGLGRDQVIEQVTTEKVLTGVVTLVDVENALVNASNTLAELKWNQDQNESNTCKCQSLDTAIDTALRLVQAWREEAGV